MHRYNTETQQKTGQVEVEWLVTLTGMAGSQLYVTNCSLKKYV